MLAVPPENDVRKFCRRYGVSLRTGYKWLDRYREQGYAGLQDQSRRPLSSPARKLHHHYPH
ncbi:hypothetical protein EGJ86_17595 [Pseudomonas sp. o96-267]|nr:hypothetical protein EGJ86_17595 [Pseudomonas sp. o96-267]